VDEGYIEQKSNKKAVRDSREKSIQRDLVFLRDVCELPIHETQGDGRALLWQYSGGNANTHTNLEKDADLALTVIMAERFLRQILPASTVGALGGMLASAKELLERRKRLNSVNYLLLQQRVVFDQRGGRLTQADTHPDILRLLVDAIVKKRRIKFQYRDSERWTEGSVCGLLIKSPKLYAVIIPEAQPDSPPRHYLAHRIRNIEVSNQQTRVDDSFSMDEYVQNWLAEPLVDPAHSELEILKLKVKDTGNLVADLRETGIGINPEIKSSRKKGVYDYSATVRVTYPLVEWILARGGDVEVMHPKWLRAHVVERITKMYDVYKS
jgi:predicted DNA-binding transcriptional regulator YafY